MKIKYCFAAFRWDPGPNHKKGQIARLGISAKPFSELSKEFVEAEYVATFWIPKDDPVREAQQIAHATKFKEYLEAYEDMVEAATTALAVAARMEKT